MIGKISGQKSPFGTALGNILDPNNRSLSRVLQRVAKRKSAVYSDICECFEQRMGNPQWKGFPHKPSQ